MPALPDGCARRLRSARALLHPTMLAGGIVAGTRARRAGWAALAAALVVASTPAAAQQDTMTAPTADTVTDRLIIKYRAGSAAARTSDFSAMARSHEALNRNGLQMRFLRRTANAAAVMQLDRPVSAAVAARMARDIAASDASVEYAEPDRRVTAQATPNDPRFLDQWHYFEVAAGINLPPAWDRSTGSGVVVAVLDTGIRPHPDLVDRLVPGYDFIDSVATAADGNGRDGDPTDPGDGTAADECGFGTPARASSWHGTHVGGTIAASTGNGVGVAGVAYNARLMPVRVLGRCGGYTSDIADAVIWASGGTVAGVPNAAQRAHVINMSLAGFGTCDTTLSNAVAQARSRGTLVVVAAANGGSDAANYFPASCPGVVAVAAVNRTGARAGYSNFGSLIDLAAPGGEGSASVPGRVLSTSNSGGTGPGADIYSGKQGTSMAAPHVSGVAALMIAAAPGIGVDQLEALLKATARPFPAPCDGCGSGIVDAAAAVAAVADAAPLAVADIEPNNTRAKAQVVASLPARVSGRMQTATDNDQFRVTVGAGQTLEARLQSTAPGDNTHLQLFDASGASLGRSVKAVGLEDRVAWTNTAAAAVAVFVRVRYASGSFGASAGAYQLQLAASAP